MSKSHKNMLFASAAAGVLAAPFVAHAQDSGTGREGPVLEEIVVTADRTGTDAVQVGSFRGAKIIDTPLTISVISEEVLKSQQAASLLDALRNTPGVTSSQTNTTVYNNLSIRGIPVENRGNYRLNGSLPIVNLIDLPLENKVRVEALKGASALYYGFTPPSGIINLITKRPPQDLLVYGEVKGNGHGQVQGHIDVGGTMGIFGARGNFVYGNVDSGIDRTSGKRSFASGAFQLKPTDTLTFNIDVEQIYKRVTEPTIIQGPTARANLLTVIPDAPKGSTNPGSEGFMNKAEETNVLARAAWNISSQWQLVAEGGISYAKRDRRFSRLENFNPTTGTGTLNAGAADGQLYRNRNIRAELAGTFETGPIVHELLVGASKNIRRQYSTSTTTVARASSAVQRQGCVALGLASDCVQNLYDPIPLADVRFNGTVPYNPARDTKIHDTGFYAFDRARFGGPDQDLVSLLIGIRQSDYKETVANAAGGDTTRFSDKPLSISGGIVIKPREWVSVYGTYIEGLESTPGAPSSANNAGEILPASGSTQYEGGIKLQPNRDLLFTAAYFDISRANAYVNAANDYVKDGKASYRGLELSATGNVTPDFSIYASALFLDAKQGETDDATLIGNDIENTAKTTWSVFAEYRFSQLVPGLALNAGVYHVGKRAINPENSAYLPSYTLLNIGGSYTAEIGETEVTFRVTGENVTGERYWSSAGGNYLAWGAPPTVKFSVAVNLF